MVCSCGLFHCEICELCNSEVFEFYKVGVHPKRICMECLVKMVGDDSIPLTNCRECGMQMYFDTVLPKDFCNVCTNIILEDLSDDPYREVVKFMKQHPTKLDDSELIDFRDLLRKNRLFIDTTFADGQIERDLQDYLWRMFA